MPKALLVVTDHYPSRHHATRGVFVYRLVQEFCRLGTQVEVIAPRKLVDPRGVRRPTYGAELARVVRPLYASLSNRIVLPGLSTLRLGQQSFIRATMKGTRRVQRPELVYAHFVVPGGMAGVRVAEMLDVPCVISLGESGFAVQEKHWGRERIAAVLRQAEGIIAVSTEVRDYCVHSGQVDPARICVLPNAVDTESFRPGDRRALRAQLGWPEDAFVVAFVGHFIERKGGHRLLEAIRKCAGTYGVFVGSGPAYWPTGDQVLHVGPVLHHELPKILGACDVFALPTLAEGSSNSANEALASGLPLIVSDIPAMREQVTGDVAIFVNPTDVDAIAQAIMWLRDEPVARAQMAIKARQLAETRTLRSRAERVLHFLDQTIERQAMDACTEV